MNSTIKRGLLTAIKQNYSGVKNLIYNEQSKQVAWTNTENQKFVQDAGQFDLGMLMSLYKLNRLDFIEIDFQTEKITLTGDKEIIV